MLSLNHKDTWSGADKSISFEISRWRHFPEDKDRWNYYLIIPVKLVEKDLKPINCIEVDGEYPYYMDILRDSELFNLQFHGGITFCKRLDGGLVKIGCDFSHYHDEGRTYTLEQVSSELENTLTLFHQYFNAK